MLAMAYPKSVCVGEIGCLGRVWVIFQKDFVGVAAPRSAGFLWSCFLAGNSVESRLAPNSARALQLLQQASSAIR